MCWVGQSLPTSSTSSFLPHSDASIMLYVRNDSKLEPDKQNSEFKAALLEMICSIQIHIGDRWQVFTSFPPMTGLDCSCQGPDGNMLGFCQQWYYFLVTTASRSALWGKEKLVWQKEMASKNQHDLSLFPSLSPLPTTWSSTSTGETSAKNALNCSNEACFFYKTHLALRMKDIRFLLTIL